MAEYRYVSDVSPNGWLKVKLENGNIVALSYTIKLEYYETKNGREYFKILEGEHEGKKATVQLKSSSSSYLIKSLSVKSGASVTFIKSQNKLIISSLGTYIAVTDPTNPTPNGNYNLEIPESPHTLGSGYTSYSRYAENWFRVGHSGDRFLHVGERSAGCVTVKDKNKWTEIYQFLILCRKDRKSVGTISVKDR